MAPHTRTLTGKSKKKKKIAAMDDVDDDNYNDTGGEKDTKRQRTDDDDDDGAVPPDPVASATGTAAPANNRDDNELPSSDELSEELCNIISNRYSRDEALRTLERLCKWAFTQDSDFLKSFHRYSGVVKVLDFLKKTMKD